MGKIQLHVEARKKYKCDRVTIRIQFQSTAGTSSQATLAAMDACETFLKRLEQEGVPPQMVHLDDDQTNLDEFKNNPVWNGSRSLELSMAYDPVTLNRLLSMLSALEINCEISTTYSCHDMASISKELVTIALDQARERAKTAARSMNRRLIGVGRLTIERRYHSSPMDWMAQESERGVLLREAPGYTCSDELDAPEKEFTQSIDITYLTD